MYIHVGDTPTQRAQGCMCRTFECCMGSGHMHVYLGQQTFLHTQACALPYELGSSPGIACRDDLPGQHSC